LLMNGFSRSSSEPRGLRGIANGRTFAVDAVTRVSSVMLQNDRYNRHDDQQRHYSEQNPRRPAILVAHIVTADQH